MAGHDCSAAPPEGTAAPTRDGPPPGRHRGQWERGQAPGLGGWPADDGTGRQVGPARGIVYGARREIEQLAAGRVGRRGAMIGTMGSVAGAGAAVGGAAGPGEGSVVARPRLFGRLAVTNRDPSDTALQQVGTADSDGGAGSAA